MNYNITISTNLVTAGCTDIAQEFNTGPFDTEQDALDYLDSLASSIPSGTSIGFAIIPRLEYTVNGTGE